MNNLKELCYRCETIEQVQWMIDNLNLSPRIADEGWEKYGQATCYYQNLENGRCVSYSDLGWALSHNYEITKVSDLIGDKPTKDETPVEYCYVTCTLIDGTILDFDKLVDRVDEFGKNDDMLKFVSENLDGSAHIAMAVIPKSQIKKIDFVHTDEEIKVITDSRKQITNAGDRKEG